MLNKILAALLIVALAGIVGLGVMLRKADSRAVEATKKAEVYQRSFETEQRAVAALEKSLAAQKAASKQHALQAARDKALANALQKDLNEALKANPAWADQPVPDGVWDSITR
jgi:hypothetical protein